MAPNSIRFDKDPKRSRSFTLSAFRKSAAREPQLPVPPVAAAAPPRKAMPWRWHRRAEPAGADRQPPAAPPAESAGADRGAESAECPPQPPHSTSDARRPSPEAGGVRPPATPPSTGPPTPLYDEVELYGLTSQMADFLHRLQTKQADQQKSAAATNQSAVRRSRSPPSTDEAMTIRRSISSCAALGFSYGFRGPISALHKLLRKALPGHHPATTKARSAANITARSVSAPTPGGEEDAQYHYHHYVHHHHFHYHYDPAANPSLDEASFTQRSRRHSESSDIRGRIPALIYEESPGEEENEEENKSPLSAFLARRRRNSDSAFAERYNAMKAAQSEAKRAAVGGPADHGERKWFSRRYNSERYASKAKAGGMQEEGGGVDEELWKSGGLKARRRHSTEMWREDAGRRVGYPASTMIRAMEEAARVARGGEMAEADGPLYNLSGAEGEAAGMARRRSASFLESCRRAEGLAHGGGLSEDEDGRTPSPARRRWGQEPPALHGHQPVYSLS